MANSREQLHSPEHVEGQAEIKPEDLEAFVQRLVEASEALIHEGLQAPAQARLEAMQRLGETPGEARALVNRTLEAARTLQAELKDQLHPTTMEPTVPLEDHAAALELAASIADKEIDKPSPAIDGVTPPDAAPAGAGDDDELEEIVEKEEEIATTQIEDVVDLYADRNKASANFLEKLADPDFSFPGQSDPELLKTIRELLILHANEELAIRTDDLGNLIIGVPETGGNGLRTRLLTIHHDTDQGTLNWLQRSMAEEFNTLKRYPVAVIEDRQLGRTHTAEALAA